MLSWGKEGDFVVIKALYWDQINTFRYMALPLLYHYLETPQQH